MDTETVQSLLEHYDTLLNLYGKMEENSQAVYEIMKSGSRVTEIADILRESARVAESIKQESETIVKLKERLAEKRPLTDRERRLVRQSEESLSQAVDRVIACEDRTRGIMTKQGVKISRR